MRDHQAIFRELRTSIAEALRRSEERMSHVQRQLAGWQAHAGVPSVASSKEQVARISRTIAASDREKGQQATTDSVPGNVDETGWNTLQAQTEAITAGVDQELATVQASLQGLIASSKPRGLQ